MPAGLAEEQIIARPAARLAFEGLAALRWVRWQLPPGTPVMPASKNLRPGNHPGHEIDEHDQRGHFVQRVTAGEEGGSHDGGRRND
jgi:hypothetical protein